MVLLLFCTGALAVPLMVLVVVGSPRLIAMLRRRSFRLPRSVMRGIDAGVRALARSNPAPVPLQPPLEWHRPSTDVELCRAWCATYEALQAATTRRKRLALVEERRTILDELARRNSAAFLAWLVEATPDDDPLPYIGTDYLRRTVINWDELIGGSD